MIRIEITDDKITERVITATSTGKQYAFREQTAWAYLVGPNGYKDPHPSKIQISLERDTPAFPVGNYTVDACSLFINKYSALDLGRLHLKPLQTAPSK